MKDTGDGNIIFLHCRYLILNKIKLTLLALHHKPYKDKFEKCLMHVELFLENRKLKNIGHVYRYWAKPQNTYRKFMLFLLCFPTYLRDFSNTAHTHTKKKISVHWIMQQSAMRLLLNSSRFQLYFGVLSHRKNNLLVKVMDSEIQNSFLQDAMKVTDTSHLWKIIRQNPRWKLNPIVLMQSSYESF